MKVLELFGLGKKASYFSVGRDPDHQNDFLLIKYDEDMNELDRIPRLHPMSLENVIHDLEVDGATQVKHPESERISPPTYED